MATIKINHSYTLADNLLKTKLDEMLVELEAKYPISFHWESECCLKLKRSGVNGEIYFRSGSLSVTVKLGMMLAAFKSAIEKDIRKFLTEKIF